MAAYAALVSVMHIIDNLKLHPRPPISLPQKQHLLLTEKVTFLQEFLQAYNPHLGYSTEADPLESRITDAAYAAEDVIESHIVDQVTNDGEKKSSDGSLYEALEKVIQELALIQKDAMEIKDTLGVQNQSRPLDSMTTTSSSSFSSIAQKGISMVGGDDLKLQLMDKLTSHCPDLQIIPITGMGGAGKTTLVVNIYQRRFIKECFDICASVTISQEYNTRDMLREVLDQLINQNVDKDLSEYELGEKLYKYLFGRKYLIIMDDMWSIDAWNEVARFLPDNKNGSKIVVTTRILDVASKLPNSNSLKMELLNEADSWDLLSKSVFGVKGCCPLELEEIGKRIGKSCKGLPISIVVIGGILAKSEQTSEFWEYIDENLNSIVNSEDDERCLKTLHMSYKHLPINLKSCFLYMGVFREDEMIHVSRLVKFWVAEGFLKPMSGKILEEIAKENLNDLIDRNLVMIGAVDRTTGNMKYCKIHDLLRDLCLREAQKDKFYGVVSSPTTLQTIVNGQHRIVKSKDHDAINALSISMPLASPLVWNFKHQRLSLGLRFNRLLRILYPREPTAIELAEFLVNSRFLDLLSPSTEYGLPSSIWLFWNLQILICHELCELWAVQAPTDLWYMPYIRHVKFQCLCLPEPPNDQGGIVLGNLQTLGVIENFKCSEQVIKRIPNIKKLKIMYDYDWQALHEDDEFCVRNFHFLDKLESLSCSFWNLSGHGSLCSLISFPHSLKKLKLSIGPLEWDGILEKIGVLPLLGNLTLERGSFKEKQWVTTKGQFCSLKILVLIDCQNLQVWTAESSHFPCLEHLSLYKMSELKEIPLEFADMPTLRVIWLRCCSDSAVESTKRILVEQEESNGEVTIQVYGSITGNRAVESLASPS